MAFFSSLFQSFNSMFTGKTNVTPTVTTDPAPAFQVTLPEESPTVVSKPAFTAEILGAITTSLKPALLAPYASAIDSAMEMFNISTPVVQAMFLAQIMHESGGGIWLTELASGQAYEGRADLGNTHPGDGVKYKGRGFIQITGLFNYQAVSKALGHDFVANPADLAQPLYAAQSAGWYWNSRGLTSIAQAGTLDAFESVTRKINGGLNGLADRQAYWAKAKTALGVS